MSGLLERVAWVLDDLTHRAGAMFGQTIDSYCDLETAEVESSTILVDRLGGMATLFELGGCNDIPGLEETHRTIDRLVSSLAPFMSDSAYSLQFVFEYDPDPVTGEQLIDDYVFRLKRGAERNGLANIDDLIEDTARALSAHCAFERCTLVASTSTRLLRAKALKEERQRNAEYKRANLPGGEGVQNSRLSLSPIVDAHVGFVEQIKGALGRCGVAATLLDAHSACRLIRNQIDPEFTYSQWTPTLPGDPVPLTDNGRPDISESDLGYPQLVRQLIPRDPEVRDLKSVQIGDRIYRPLQVELPPKEPKPFARLFGSLSKTRTPYRLSLRIQGAALERMNARFQIADSLRFAGSQNKRIAEAFKAVERFVKDENGVAVAITLDAATWVHTSQADRLQRRANQLSAALQAWGNAQVDEQVGSPLDAITASVAGLRLTSPSNVAPRTLETALLMAPLTRTHSPWPSGNLMFRSPDGKPFPYAAYSSVQDAWISLIFAPMGRGKSVLLNALNLALCLDEGNTGLPTIRILDIGPSSSGLISLLRTALPEDQTYQALYQKLQMSSDCAFNVLDTPLGCRYPLPSHVSYLTDFLSLLATEDGNTAPRSGISGIAKLVIDMAYKRYSDEQTPKVYNPGIEPAVDEAIDRFDLAVDDDTTWWELTDALTAAGDTVTAHVAQSRAMPLLSELAALARSNAVSQFYTGEVETRETMGVYFWRMLTEACSDYPILNAPTQLNFGSARVVSLNLQDVAPSGGGSRAARQTGIMYSVALWVMTRDFFLDEDSLASMPVAYHAYHSDRIESLSKSKKRVAADEFHRTQGQPMVKAVFETVIREGRKFQVEIILASQRDADFSDTMIELSTTRFVLGAGLGGAREIARRIDLDGAAVDVMRKSLTGPGPGGSNVLASFNVKDRPGRYNHLLTLTLGSRALWAFSTTKADAYLRDRLYARLGDTEARRILSERYPGGTVSADLKRRNTQIGEGSDYGDIFDADHDPLREIEMELLEASRVTRPATNGQAVEPAY